MGSANSINDEWYPMVNGCHQPAMTATAAMAIVVSSMTTAQLRAGTTKRQRWLRILALSPVTMDSGARSFG